MGYKREREKQFALFSDVVIHRYKFSNRPFCISSSRDQLSVKTKTVRVCTILLARAERAY